MSTSNLPEKDHVFALVPENPLIRRISKRLDRTPEGLVRNIERYMKSRVEQVMYLQIAFESRTQPMEFKEILKILVGTELRHSDLQKTFDGKDHHESKIDSIEPLIAETISLLRMIPKSFGGMELKASTAATLVITYGSDAIHFIESIVEDWEEIAEMFNLPRNSQVRILRASLCMWLNNIRSYCAKQGIPDQYRFMDYFEDENGDLRFYLYRAETNIEDYFWEEGKI